MASRVGLRFQDARRDVRRDALTLLRPADGQSKVEENVRGTTPQGTAALFALLGQGCAFADITKPARGRPNEPRVAVQPLLASFCLSDTRHATV